MVFTASLSGALELREHEYSRGGVTQPDWDRKETAQAQGREFALGFERVIAHTKSTLMLMEPWDNPRAPTRVW